MLSRMLRLAIALGATLVTPVAARAQQPADTTKPDTTKAAPPSYPAPPSPATTPAPKPAAPAFNFSAWVFGNYQLQTDSATRAANGGTIRDRFDIERAYLTFVGGVGDRTSFRVTTDIKQNVTSGGNYNGWFVRLKYGYLQYSFLQPAAPSGLAAWARIGMLHTVIIDHEESFWPRYVAKTAVERQGFFSSSDLGAATGWTLPNRWGEIYGTVTNGNGYENPEADRFKDFALRVSLTPLGGLKPAGKEGAGSTKPLLSTFTISPWVYLGRKSSAFLVTDSVTDGLERNRYGVFVGLKDPRLTVGAEWAQNKDQTETGTSVADRVVTGVTGRLLDGFVIVRPTLFGDPGRKNHNVGILGRVDYFKPNSDASLHQNFYVAGVFWEPTPKAALALDYQRQEYKGVAARAPAPAPTQEVWYLHWTVTF